MDNPGKEAVCRKIERMFETLEYEMPDVWDDLTFGIVTAQLMYLGIDLSDPERALLIRWVDDANKLLNAPTIT